MSRRRPLTVLLALALAGGSQLAQAQESPGPLPLGTDGQGVRLVERGRPAHFVVVLSPQRYRKVAGRDLRMVCAPVPEATLGGGAVGGPRNDFRPRPRGGVVARLHPPRHHTPLVTRIAPDWDWCALSVRKVRNHGHSISETGIATVPLTAAGAAFADERRVAVRVIMIEFFLFLQPKRVKLAARWMHAVVLAAPTQEPPPGRLGIYSDGRRHVYAAQRDRAGDLLFFEHDGDVTRTNLLRYLQDDSLLWGLERADLAP
jgi:hypothetical protein